MTRMPESPLQRARRAHRSTTAPPELDARILHRPAAAARPRVERPPLWVPVFTTCAVLALGLWLAPRDAHWSAFDSGPVRPVEASRATGGETPPERQEFLTARLAPTAGFSLRLWEEGETGIRSILDSETIYQAAPGVEVELLSPFATLENHGETVTQLAGAVRWHAEPPAGSACLVEAAGWLFAAEDATFSLDVSPREVTVEVNAGEVAARPRGALHASRRLTAGKRMVLAIPESPVPATPQRVWTREEIEKRLHGFAEAQNHEAAAEFVTRILPEVEADLRESLLFDLASIYGHHLRDWDRACLTLDRLVREFPATALMEGVEQLRTRYRCPPASSAPERNP